MRSGCRYLRCRKALSTVRLWSASRTCAATCRYLRCRKALSTFEQFRMTNRLHKPVQIPQMPKGVEHTCLVIATISASLVQIPQMPKGVEHMDFMTVRHRPFIVQIPQMPKGVEHL